jgi:hypothetical protein
MKAVADVQQGKLFDDALGELQKNAQQELDLTRQAETAGGGNAP